MMVVIINSLTRQCHVCMRNFRPGGGKKWDRPRSIVRLFFAHLPLRPLNPPLIATSLLHSLQCGRCRSRLPLILAASLGERRTDLKRLSYLFRSRERRTDAAPPPPATRRDVSVAIARMPMDESIASSSLSASYLQHVCETCMMDGTLEAD